MDRALASESGGRGFEALQRKTKGVTIGSGCFLVRHSVLRGSHKDWLARCQDNVTEWCTCVCGTVHQCWQHSKRECIGISCVITH